MICTFVFVLTTEEGGGFVEAPRAITHIGEEAEQPWRRKAHSEEDEVAGKEGEGGGVGAGAGATRVTSTEEEIADMGGGEGA